MDNTLRNLALVAPSLSEALLSSFSVIVWDASHQLVQTGLVTGFTLIRSLNFNFSLAFVTLFEHHTIYFIIPVSE